MPDTTTIKVRVSPKVKTQLGRLAQRTSRSQDRLATKAITDYVTRELAIIDGVTEGLADLANGRLVPHDRAMARIDGAIRKAAKRSR